MLGRLVSPPGRPSLRAELLFNLAFLAAAALILGVGTALLVNALAPGLGPTQLFLLILVIVALDVGIFIVFGSYLVRRHVLRPVERLVAAADAVADGDLVARAPDAETRDFSVLGERLNRMTDHLLDAQGYLVRAEKLASVGRLAAGIAHEVGNPLGAIGTYVEVLRRRGAEAEVTDGITREIARIDRIVRSLLDYARPHDEVLQPVDPAAVLEGAMALLRAQGALKGVRATVDTHPDVPRVLGRAHALEQAVVNLVLNAVDAARDGDVVAGARRWAYEAAHAPPRRSSDPRWSIFPRPPDRRPARPEVPAGTPGALLFVADSGPGVPPEDREQVFDPFYTTKEPGRGTGLGLAIVQRTVFELGGVVWVDAAREGGAAFKIFLPELRAAA
ncbi:MAG: sensor histidine kinase [Gemmatimonadales bacterium]